MTINLTLQKKTNILKKMYNRALKFVLNLMFIVNIISIEYFHNKA